jgi:hypothetical protein
MKESDIKWENEARGLWIGKTKYGFTLFKSGSNHATGFLSFDRLDDAIDNAEALKDRPDVLAKLLRVYPKKAVK